MFATLLKGPGSFLHGVCSLCSKLALDPTGKSDRDWRLCHSFPVFAFSLATSPPSNLCFKGSLALSVIISGSFQERSDDNVPKMQQRPRLRSGAYLGHLLYAPIFSLPLESRAVQKDIYEHEKWSRMASVFRQGLACIQCPIQ